MYQLIKSCSLGNDVLNSQLLIRGMILFCVRNRHQCMIIDSDRMNLSVCVIPHNGASN